MAGTAAVTAEAVAAEPFGGSPRAGASLQSGSTRVADAACQQYWSHAQSQTGVEPRVQEALTTIGFAAAGVSPPQRCNLP